MKNILLILIASSFTMIISGCLESKAISNLPNVAEDVHEYCDASWSGDYVRLVKAKLPHEKLREYAQVMGLTECCMNNNNLNNVKKKVLLSSLSEVPIWWKQPDEHDIDKFYYYINPEIYDFQTAFWHKGYLYYINYVCKCPFSPIFTREARYALYSLKKDKGM